MGSSGSKRSRKGGTRQHLPKVGSPANEAWERHEGIEHMEHPFADDPSERHGPWAAVIAVIVIVALVASLVGWLFIT